MRGVVEDFRYYIVKSSETHVLLTPTIRMSMASILRLLFTVRRRSPAEKIGF